MVWAVNRDLEATKNFSNTRVVIFRSYFVADRVRRDIIVAGCVCVEIYGVAS